MRNDKELESLDFIKLTDAATQSMRKNPVTNSGGEREENNPRKVFNSRKGDPRFAPRGCTYCGDLNHKAVQCEKISDRGERKKILARKGLCFNCATKPHRAACSRSTSRSSCGHCAKRHHTSICDQNTGSKTDKHAPPDELMTDGDSGEGIFLVVVIKVYGSTFLHSNRLRRRQFLRFCEKRPAN